MASTDVQPDQFAIELGPAGTPPVSRSPPTALDAPRVTPPEFLALAPPVELGHAGHVRGRITLPPLFRDATPAPAPAPTLPRVLMVDADLASVERLAAALAGAYAFTATSSGMEALSQIRHGGSFAVIVTGMQLPDFDGAILLEKVRGIAPETTRMILTGRFDTPTAVGAINHGQVFRLLPKPCPPEVLHEHLVEAVRLHRLVTGERELLERTLTGVVELLTDLLALSAPIVFSRASRLRAAVRSAAEKLRMDDPWECELAALLCLIGCITLPPELVARAFAGLRITPEDRAALEQYPEVGYRLLSTIPRLDNVAEIVKRQRAGARAGVPAIDRAVDVLRAALDCDELVTRGLSAREITDELRRRRHAVDVVAALVDLQGNADVNALTMTRLTPGMTLERDIVARTGQVLLKAGSVLTMTTLDRLRRYAITTGVVEPLYVRMPVADGGAPYR